MTALYKIIEIPESSRRLYRQAHQTGLYAPCRAMQIRYADRLFLIAAIGMVRVICFSFHTIWQIFAYSMTRRPSQKEFCWLKIVCQMGHCK
jgi:hypothetical protein